MTSHSHYRMELNNYLQSHGGTSRLRWEPIKEGPDDSPTWTVKAILDNAERACGTGKGLDVAKEEAALQVLRHLVPNFGA